MAITVNLYSFTKRENSTKRPTGTGTAYDCTLIDETSLMNPVFKLSIAQNPIGKNYAFVSDFNRYYFITDITSKQNFWYISCTCDVLASFKTELGSQSHYILRSDSEYDGNITDNVYPAKSSVITYKDSANNGYDPLHFDYSYEYSFILGIVGLGDDLVSNFGAIRYYVLKPYGLKNFMSYLMNNVDSWGGIAQTDYSLGVQKALINPIQYIKSCICVPLGYDDINPSDRSYIKFGYYRYDKPSSSSDDDIGVITDDIVVKTMESTYFTLRDHPQAASRGAYLNKQPFTKYTLHYGPWGDIDIDPMLLRSGNALKLQILYDLIAGTGRLIVRSNASGAPVVFNGTAKVSVDVNLSQVYKDALGYEKATTNTLFGSISAGTNAAMSNNPIGGIASGLGFITSGVQDMTRLNYPTVSGVGSSGSYLSFKDPENLYLISKFMDIVDENREEIGRPLCKTRQINTLSGYILCDKADCQITGIQDEAIKINHYLNSGFFYE